MKRGKTMTMTTIDHQSNACSTLYIVGGLPVKRRAICAQGHLSRAGTGICHWPPKPRFREVSQSTAMALCVTAFASWFLLARYSLVKSLIRSNLAIVVQDARNCQKNLVTTAERITHCWGFKMWSGEVGLRHVVFSGSSRAQLHYRKICQLVPMGVIRTADLPMMHAQQADRVDQSLPASRCYMFESFCLTS